MSKRILSLVLALVMVLGTFGTVFAAETAAVSVEKDAATFLNEAKILKGDDKGDLMLNQKLERRDMVILLSRLMGEEEVASKFPVTEVSPTWADVRTDAYYLPVLAWGEVNKFFEGKTAKAFGPREAMTAQDYSLVLLRALGYEVTGHDAWKAALADAKKLGILADVVVEDATEITRGQMSVMTFNALGVAVKDSTKTLAETLNITMPEAPKADKLTAEVNETENLAEIVVELSNAELTDTLKLENPSNYKLSDNKVVKTAEVVGDNVILTVAGAANGSDTALVKGRQYTLTIKGIDKAINGEHKFKAFDNTAPVVESVEVLGEYGIKITTSEPVQKPQERNILIDGKRVAMVVEQYGRDIVIRPYHSVQFNKDAKEIEITSLVDYAGYSSSLTREAIEIVNDEVAPKVVSATRSGKTVTVVFDKNIYGASVKGYVNSRDSGNVSYVEGRQTIYTQLPTSTTNYGKKIATNVAEYTFEKELPRNVEILVEGVQNHSKVTMEKTTVTPELVAIDYAGIITNNSERIALRVDRDVYNEANNTLGVVYSAELSLKIKFDEPIKSGSINHARLSDNFVLYEKEVSARGERAARGVSIERATLSTDGKEITVVFKNLMVNDRNKNFDYTLEVMGLEDTNNFKLFRDYLDFEVVPTSLGFAVDRLGLKSVTSRDTTEYTIAFNDFVNEEAALDAKNYFLVEADGTEVRLDKIEGSYVIVDRNGKDITLVIPMSRADVTADYSLIRILPRVTSLGGKLIPAADRDLSLGLF